MRGGRRSLKIKSHTRVVLAPGGGVVITGGGDGGGGRSGTGLQG